MCYCSKMIKVRNFIALSILFLCGSAAIGYAEDGAYELGLPTISNKAGTFTDPSSAVIYDVDSESTDRFMLEKGSDEFDRSPMRAPPINNDPEFYFPIDPADPRIVKIFADYLNGRSECTGSVISRSLVLTAGHCFYSHSRGGFARTVTVIPGYMDGQSEFGEFRAAKLVGFNGWIDGEDDAHDIGVIQLRAQLPDTILPFGYGAFGYRCPDSADADRPHYNPNLANGNRQYTVVHKRLGCHLGLLFHRQRTGPGSSGSPSVRRSSLSIRSVAQSQQTGDGGLFVFDARLTGAKVCYITEQLQGGFCFP